jgi:hypothetical protein
MTHHFYHTLHKKPLVQDHHLGSSSHCLDRTHILLPWSYSLRYGRGNSVMNSPPWPTFSFDRFGVWRWVLLKGQIWREWLGCKRVTLRSLGILSRRKGVLWFTCLLIILGSWDLDDRFVRHTRSQCASTRQDAFWRQNQQHSIKVLTGSSFILLSSSAMAGSITDPLKAGSIGIVSRLLCCGAPS